MVAAIWLGWRRDVGGAGGAHGFTGVVTQGLAGTGERALQAERTAHAKAGRLQRTQLDDTHRHLSLCSIEIAMGALCSVHLVLARGHLGRPVCHPWRSLSCLCLACGGSARHALCPLTFQTRPYERRQDGKPSPEGTGAKSKIPGPVNPSGLGYQS